MDVNVNIDAIGDLIGQVADTTASVIQDVVAQAAPVIEEILTLATQNPAVAVGLVAVVAWIILLAVAG